MTAPPFRPSLHQEEAAGHPPPPTIFPFQKRQQLHQLRTSLIVVHFVQTKGKKQSKQSTKGAAASGTLRTRGCAPFAWEPTLLDLQLTHPQRDQP